MKLCKECRWWKPDLFFVYLGECEKRPGAFEEGRGGCEDYNAKSLDIEFMWCRDCMTTFHRSELKKHKGHEIFYRVHVDNDVHELTCAGD